MEELCWASSRHFVHLNVAFVVVWHVHLEPTIAIKVSGVKAANSSFGINDKIFLILKLGCITGWSEEVSGEGTIASDEDMSALA